MLLRAALVPSEEVVEELRRVCALLAGTGLRVVTPDRLEVVLARFGNVTTDVAERLVDALASSLSVLEPCVLAFSDAHFDGRSLVLDLVGETALMGEVADTVARTAEARRIYVDRRIIRRGLVLGELDHHHAETTGEPWLAGLHEWCSKPWLASEVTLVRTGWRGAEPVGEPWAAVPLARTTDHTADAIP